MSTKTAIGSARLEHAARALISAAGSEADKEQICKNFDSLKETFDTKLEVLNQSVLTSNEKFDTTFNQLHSNVVDVKNEVTSIGDHISSIKNIIGNDDKCRRLEFALANTDIGAFKYIDFTRTAQNSKDLVRTILISFRKGFGYYVGEENFDPSYKDPKTLAIFITPKGKIVSRTYTKLTQKMQKKLAREVKRARHLSLLPYVSVLR